MKDQTPSPDAIENRLVQLGAELSSARLTPVLHRDQSSIPEWRGADVFITSNFTWEPKDFMDGHDLLVRTQHAKSLTWLFFELRDTFSGWLDAGNKYGFYATLAQAAQQHLTKHQPEAEDPRPLLKDVLTTAFQWLEVLRRDGELPEQPRIILHEQDAEGRQRRIDAETGENCA